MRHPRLLLSAVAFLLLTPRSALAFEFGIGVETGWSYTHQISDSGGFNLGLILEQRFQIPAVEMTLWEDIQGPMDFENGWAFGVVDIGLRAGLPGPLFKPYIGLLVNDSFGDETTACLCDSTTASFIPGVGGDLGLDLAVAFLRFGIELRGYWTLVAPVTGTTAAGAVVVQGLLSARAEF